MDIGHQFLASLFPFLYNKESESHGQNGQKPTLDVLDSEENCVLIIAAICSKLEELYKVCEGELIMHGYCTDDSVAKLCAVWGVPFLLPKVLHHIASEHTRLECQTMIFVVLHQVHTKVSHLRSQDIPKYGSNQNLFRLQRACVESCANSIDPAHAVLLAQIPIPETLSFHDSVTMFYGTKQLVREATKNCDNEPGSSSIQGKSKEATPSIISNEEDVVETNKICDTTSNPTKVLATSHSIVSQATDDSNINELVKLPSNQNLVTSDKSNGSTQVTTTQQDQCRTQKLTFLAISMIHITSPKLWGGLADDFDNQVLEFGVTHSNLLTGYHMALYNHLKYLERNADVISNFSTRYCELCHIIRHVISISHPPPQSLLLETNIVRQQIKLLMECGWSADALIAAQALLVDLKKDMARWKKERAEDLKATRLRRGITRPKPKRRLVSRFHPEPVEAAGPDYLIAEIVKVWVQVDPIVNRNIEEYYRSNETVLEEELTSIHPGTFRMYKGQLEWIAVSKSVKRSARRKAHRLRKEQAQLCNHDIALYETGSPLWGCERMLAAVSQQIQDPLQVTEENRGDANRPWGPRSLCNEYRNPKYEISDSLLVVNVKDIQQFTWGEVDDNSYFLSILGTQVYKFFPLTYGTITELLKAITHLTGLDAFTDRKYSSLLKEKQLCKLREKVLDEFLTDYNNEWITHTKDLHETIDSITENSNAVNVYDLERLFHSCRLNRQVLVETFNIVEALWRKKLAPRDQGSRTKILCIIDRLLDPQVINGDSEMIARILHWLRITETTLDAGMCKLSMKHITMLLEKIPRLQTHRITSISSERVAELTEGTSDFDTLTRYFFE